jgi:hypothetical protein
MTILCFHIREERVNNVSGSVLPSRTVTERRVK